MYVKGRGGRQNDEVHDDVGEEHARDNVRLGPLEFGIGRAPPLRDGSPTSGPVLLDLLGSLPEEEIRRNCRPQDSDQRGEVVVAPFDMREHRSAEDRPPVRSGQECGQHVREENEGEPFEDSSDLAIGGPEKQRDDDPGVEGRPEDCLHACHHLSDLRHATEVRPDIDDVRDDEQTARSPEDAPRIAMADGTRQSPARHEAEAGAHQLDRRHQGKGKEGGPEGGIAKSRTRDGVGGDAGGIVVRRPGDQTGAEHGEKLSDAR